jgi:TPR repeat protein
MTLEHLHSDPEALFLEAENAEENGDMKAANQFLLEAAKLGHTGAQVSIANNYSSGRGIARSLDKAAYWYRRAYEAGDESGALNLAIDKLKAGNTRAAILWLKRAIELHSGEAALELAKLYAHRRGGKAKALELLKLTQRMRASEISEQAKEDAAKLLSSLTR